MRVLIAYFSGTGNTEYVARYLAQRLGESTSQVNVRPLESCSAEFAASYDLLIVGYPVYALDSPGLVQRWLADLPSVEGKAACVFSTHAFATGGAERRNLEHMRQRGYVPLGGVSVGMPGSDGLLFAPQSSWIERWARKKKPRFARVDGLVDRLELALVAVAAGGSWADWEYASVSGMRVKPSWAHWLHRQVFQWVTKKLAVDEECTSCGLCVRICPVGNIQVGDEGVRFGESCELCLSCVTQCPQEAIQLTRWTRGGIRWRGPKGDYRAQPRAKR